MNRDLRLSMRWSVLHLDKTCGCCFPDTTKPCESYTIVISRNVEASFQIIQYVLTTDKLLIFGKGDDEARFWWSG